MGLLGLRTVYFLSDRIFDVLDDDKDGKIHFSDFVLYFNTIQFGDQQ
jgi:1-phosphatidylinositol-4-phosphate 5-kinase